MLILLKKHSSLTIFVVWCLRDKTTDLKHNPQKLPQNQKPWTKKQFFLRTKKLFEKIPKQLFYLLKCN